MKILRALWGVPEHVIGEIPRVPLFEDETVIVWGREHEKMLKKWGYKTYLAGEDTSDPEFSTHLKHFAHKLKALSIAETFMDEYLFLDWDVTLAKEIDDEFYAKIRSGNDVQCPLYAYHDGFRQDVEEYLRREYTFTDHQDDFLTVHMRNLDKYHWKLEGFKALPCFCFLYSRGSGIGEKLLNLTHELNLEACIEEFAMQIYVNCSLDDYIKTYEPVVIRGKERDKNLPGMTEAIHGINAYVNTKMHKDIYLLHDSA
jgi:hypothetical protein